MTSVLTDEAAEAPPRRGPGRRRLVGSLIVVAVLCGVAGAWVWRSPPPHSDPAPASIAATWQRPIVSEAALEQGTGIRLTQVAVSGAGGLLDVRFLVLDPQKAVALHRKDAPPALIDETTQVVVSSLLMDHSHTSPFRQGATYYLVFNNPGNLVKRGGNVTVLLGGTGVEHVVVK